MTVRLSKSEEADFATHREQWFPLAFEVDLRPGELERFTIHGSGYVVFRPAKGDWVALPDRCPHRSARLSDGRFHNDQVECLYHGWTWDGKGQCTRIPQLPKGAPIPERACLQPAPLRVVQGIVWLWGGDPKNADSKEPLFIPALEQADMHRIDYAGDLPYGQEALIENVLDFAHIHVAHDGARGGGHRDQAGPLAFDLEDLGSEGFHARFRSPTVDLESGVERTSGATVRFVNYGLVHFESEFEGGTRRSGLALFCVPQGAERCRLIYRAYGNFWPQADQERPRWREHRFQMELLEQDMAVVMGQCEEIKHASRPLKEIWLPIKSSDQLVLHYRRWVEEHSLAVPGARGWSTSHAAPAASTPAPMDRYNQHTRSCSACRAALQDFRDQRMYAAIGFVVALILTALVSSAFAAWLALLALCAAGWAVWSHTQIDELVRTAQPQSTPKTFQI